MFVQKSYLYSASYIYIYVFHVWNFITTNNEHGNAIHTWYIYIGIYKRNGPSIYI